MAETMWDLTGKALMLVEHSEDIDPTFFQDTWDSISDSIKVKAVDSKKIDDELEIQQNEIQARIDTINSKIKGLKSRINNIQNKRGFLKDNILMGMNAADIQNIKTPEATIFTKSYTHYDYNEGEIPKSYFISKDSLDRKHVKNDMKAGKKIPGVTESTNQTVIYK